MHNLIMDSRVVFARYSMTYSQGTVENRRGGGGGGGGGKGTTLGCEAYQC